MDVPIQTKFPPATLNGSPINLMNNLILGYNLKIGGHKKKLH